MLRKKTIETLLPCVVKETKKYYYWREDDGIYRLEKWRCPFTNPSYQFFLFHERKEKVKNV